MRGKTTRQATFTAITPDQKVPKNHPVRRIRALVEPILKGLSPVFEEMYAEIGRPSIPPEHLLKATLLMTLYSVRSERQLCERLEYDLRVRTRITRLERPDAIINTIGERPAPGPAARQWDAAAGRLAQHQAAFDITDGLGRRPRLLDHNAYVGSTRQEKDFYAPGTVDGTLMTSPLRMK